MDTGTSFYGPPKVVGTTDGGITKGAWQVEESLGTQPLGFITAPVAGLAPDTVYYYRFYATNSAGEAWAQDSAAFITPAIAAAFSASVFISATLPL